MSKEGRKLCCDLDEPRSRSCQSLPGPKLRAREVEGGSNAAIQIENWRRDTDQTRFELFVNVHPTLASLTSEPRGKIGESGRPLRARRAELQVTEQRSEFFIAVPKEKDAPGRGAVRVRVAAADPSGRPNRVRGRLGEEGQHLVAVEDRQVRAFAEFVGQKPQESRCRSAKLQVAGGRREREEAPSKPVGAACLITIDKSRLGQHLEGPGDSADLVARQLGQPLHAKTARLQRLVSAKRQQQRYRPAYRNSRLSLHVAIVTSKAR